PHGDDVILPPWDYNVAPTTHQPVIRHNRDTGDRELILMRRGLIPFFASSPEKFKDLSTILARAATLLERPTWREPFKRRRCLVPADGLYEWVRPESRPDDCPALSHDRTCRPIGSTLGGRAGW
ncbi:MAG TPA: SOS response-associated peptidase family protein, partial [Edaphobacter sp.]|nr:SOS response-associated peptidase family protein [Edaphobacter sp.]